MGAVGGSKLRLQPHWRPSWQWREHSHITPIISTSKLIVVFALFIARVGTLHKTTLPSVLFLELDSCWICCPSPVLLLTACLITPPSNKPPLSPVLMIATKVTKTGQHHMTIKRNELWIYSTNINHWAVVICNLLTAAESECLPVIIIKRQI